MSQTWKHVEVDQTPEGTTILVSGTIKDEAGTALGAADVFTITATLYDKDDPTQVVSGWDELDVKGTNGGAFDGTTKEFSLRIPPAANNLFDTDREYEIRVLLLEWTYNGGDDAGLQEVHYPIRNRPHRGTS